MLEKIKSFFYGVLMVVFFAFALSITILVLNYNEYGLTQFDDTTLQKAVSEGIVVFTTPLPVFDAALKVYETAD